jgi:hypothetical protein
MAVVMTQDQWGVRPDFIRKLTEELGVTADPPRGLIVHTAMETGGGVRIVDVWESQEALETFMRERLMPAAERLQSRENTTAPQPPQPEILEVFDLVRGDA